jgi:hypothetical protein
MAATSNSLYETTNFYGFEGHLDPYVAPREAQLSTGDTYMPRIENTRLSAIQSRYSGYRGPVEDVVLGDSDLL